jgi:hypothetical protein
VPHCSPEKIVPSEVHCHSKDTRPKDNGFKSTFKRQKTINGYIHIPNLTKAMKTDKVRLEKLYKVRLQDGQLRRAYDWHAWWLTLIAEIDLNGKG